MNSKRNKLRKCAAAVMATAAAALLSSCFTGVESTPKVTISRGDMRQIMATMENVYLDSVTPQPLAQWQKGKRFYVSDNRVFMTFMQQGLPLDEREIDLEGKCLEFQGTEEQINPDGSRSEVVVLTDGVRQYRFDTSMPREKAMTEFDSYDLEMLVDMDAVAGVDSIMRHRTYWTRSPLWYDNDGNRISGRKFVPVKVDSVGVGNMIFPLRVWFTDDEGTHAQMYMNLNGTGGGSRNFSTLFYLKDLKERYPRIDTEVWKLIQSGKVREGMTKEECRLSIGSPSNVESGITGSYAVDIWLYEDGRFLRFVDGVLTQFRQ